MLWSSAAYWTWLRSRAPAEEHSAPVPGRWRVVHGINGAIVLLYVGFHIINHLFGLIGPDAHVAVMDMGRKIYRAPLIEPLLVALMLFQNRQRFLPGLAMERIGAGFRENVPGRVGLLPLVVHP